MLYQNYNHLALVPTALVLGDYKSDIALVGCYNLYIIYIYIYIYIYKLCICYNTPMSAFIIIDGEAIIP